TIGLRQAPGIPLFEQVQTRLGSAPALVLFDNCEHLVGPCGDLVSRLLTRAHPRILVTSRTPLRVSGEQVFPVDPLPVPDPSADPGGLEQCDSVALFLERAAESDPSFTPDIDDLRAIAEICRGVEGLPLAIELAAARIRVLRVTEIAGKLDRQLALLRDATGRMGERHRALQAVIGWSYEQLSPESASAFRFLSVFAGGATLPAITFVAEFGDEFVSLDAISTLLDRSLVVVEPGATPTSRYRLLEPIRQFAAEALERAGEVHRARARHRDHFLALAEEAEPKLTGAEQGQWLDRLGADHANLLFALDNCYAEPDASLRGLRMVAALGRYWHIRGYGSLAESQLDRALAGPDGAGPSPPRARALVIAGAFASWRGEPLEAIGYLEEAIGLHRSFGNTVQEARAHLALGAAYRSLGDRGRARRICEEGLALSRTAGDKAGEATLLLNLGVLVSELGDHAAARELFGEAATLHRASGDHVTLALALGNRAGLSVQLGHFAEGASELGEALALARSVGALWAGASAISAAATLALTRDDASNSAWMFGAARTCLEKGGVSLGAREEDEMESVIARVRGGLTREEFEQAWREGRGMSFGEAADRVLAWVGALGGGVDGASHERP
ncbi:MAG: hypothetical protein R3E97_19260, partial [Candidatus Eisenbacteria bacterium]